MQAIVYLLTVFWLVLFQLLQLKRTFLEKSPFFVSCVEGLVLNAFYGIVVPSLMVSRTKHLHNYDDQEHTS